MRVGGTPFSDPRQLDAIDELIREQPDDIAFRFGRACCLEDLGRIDEALRAYWTCSTANRRTSAA